MCDRATDSPSPTACNGRPWVPTRYAAIRVLPCPGVTACHAPSPAAVNTDRIRTSGVRSAVRKIDGSSPAVTPPGTTPAVTACAAGAARPRSRPPAACRPHRAAATHRECRTAPSAGPPGDAVTATSVSASACDRRVVGYWVRRPETLAVLSSPRAAATVIPEPVTTTSRQPSRSAERPIGELDRAVGRQRRRERRHVAANLAHGRQPAHAGREREAGLGQLERLARRGNPEIE